MTNEPTHKYQLHIFWSAEDDAFLVDVPDLPGCMTHGNTPAEAARNAEEAISLWLDTARELGRPIPEPSPYQQSA